jgi:hypothetical protein
MMSLMPRLIGIAIAGPPVAVILCVVAVLIGDHAGARVFAGVPPGNLAEAAGTGRADDVVRRLRLREDPFRVYGLRPDVISSIVLRATPAEAAMWSRQLPMVQLLDREGVLGDASRRHEMTCLAADLDLQDIVAYLSPGGPPECVRGQAMDAVRARTPRPDQE